MLRVCAGKGTLMELLCFLPSTGVLESPASLASLESKAQTNRCGLSSLEGSPDLRHPEGQAMYVVPGPSVFPSGEPGVSGDFWGSHHADI